MNSQQQTLTDLTKFLWKNKQDIPRWTDRSLTAAFMVPYGVSRIAYRKLVNKERFSRQETIANTAGLTKSLIFWSSMGALLPSIYGAINTENTSPEQTEPTVIEYRAESIDTEFADTRKDGLRIPYLHELE